MTNLDPRAGRIDAPGAGDASAPGYVQAPTLRRRMASWLYESMLLFGVLFVAGYLFSSLTQMRNALHHRHALQAFLFIVCGIYFTWFWAKGQTLAMKTWHIRVVDRYGHPVSQARAFLRYLLAWLWFLPPLVVASAWDLKAEASLAAVLVWIGLWLLLTRLDPQRQFLHDRLAGTRLVCVRPSTSLAQRAV